MKPAAKPRIKICCMQSVEEAALAVRYGADAIGLVSAMPSGPGPIDDERIAAIARWAPPGVSTFLLTSALDAPAIVAQVRRLSPTTVQICDRPQVGCYAALRRALPSTRIVQVVHMTGPDALEEALEVAPNVDALLLDSGNPRLPVKELGGTGRTHDWRLSGRIRVRVSVPVWLAGGLTPDNVAAAIAAVRPFGVDVCSGLRTGGKLDKKKLAAFVSEVRRASA
jgi:phosphoribosylanthranilate isomerase